MQACPVNPSDLMFIRGQYTLNAEFPATPGFEGVGIVERAGSGLRPRLMLGKQVCVLSRRGGNWAEQNVVPATQVIPFSPLLTGSLTVEQAATFFVNPATAFVLTKNVLNVPPGTWLLQTAAGSSLGRMVIRLGKRAGFKTLCVTRRADQADELKTLGADAVLTFDAAHDDPDEFVTAVKQKTNGGVAYAMDCVGGVTGSAIVRCLTRNGQLVVFGTLSGEPLQFSSRALMTPGAQVTGFWLGNYMESLKLTKKLSLVRTIAGLIRDGVLASDIAESWPLTDFSSAIAAAERVGHTGKSLLKFE